MLRQFLKFICAVAIVAVAVIPARAQDCTSSRPWHFQTTYTCDSSTTGGPCRLDQPVTFQLGLSPFYNGTLACATATWAFDSGPVERTTTGGESFGKSLTAGTHMVQVQITVPGYPWPQGGSTSLTVARGLVEIQAASYSPEIEEGGSYSYTIARTNVDTETVVQWRAITSSGTPTTDLSPSSGSVTLAAGQVSKPLVITAPENSVSTGNRQYFIEIVSASNGYLRRSDFQRGLYVRENDFAIVDFLTKPIVVRENVGMATIEVRRTSIIDSAVSVRYSTSAYTGSPIVATSGTLNFAAGETLKFFTVPVIDDDQWTGDRSVQVELSNPSAGAKFPSGSHWNSTQLMIQDDEPAPTLSVNDVRVAEGNDGLQNVTFTINLSQGAYVELWASVMSRTAQHGSDWTGGTFFNLAFSPTSTQRTVTVQVRGDTVHERHETFVLHLERTSWTNPAILMPPDATCTILNDESLLTPNTARMARDQAVSFAVDIGLPAGAAGLEIPLLFDPAVLTAPQSLRFNSGQSQATFEVTGKTFGSSSLSLQLPPENGGKALTATINVHDSGTAILKPTHVSVFIGEEVPVEISLNPASTQAQRLPLQSGNASVATVPNDVTIPPGGTATFRVKGVARGATFVKATLPAEFGAGSVNLLVDVAERPPTPVLTSIAPATGPTAGGTSFEARGSLLTGNCSLLFGGVPATSIALVGTALTGVTPPHAAGTVDVTLRCGSTDFVLTNAFTYVASPLSISSISPSFGSMAGGTLVRAAVTNAKSGCWMFFGDAVAPYVWVNGTSEMIAVTPPRLRTENVAVAVRCGSDSSALPAAFAYSSAAEPSMSIISVDPLSGAPGQSITITGSRFRPNDNISFDDESATKLRTQPDAHIVRIPELPPGKAAITLVDAEGRMTTTGPIFTIKETAPPYVGSVNPTSAVAGSEVVLEGRGLRPGFQFVVNGFSSRIVSLDYERAMIRLSGALTPGSYPVDVRDSSGKLVATGPSLTIVARGVVVTNATPSCGSSDGGTRVTILGTGFAAGAAVTFNGVAAQNVEFVSATELRATAPAGATGNARIAVTNANGDAGAISDAFRYRSPFDPTGCASRARSARH